MHTKSVCGVVVAPQQTVAIKVSVQAHTRPSVGTFQKHETAPLWKKYAAVLFLDVSISIKAKSVVAYVERKCTEKVVGLAERELAC